VLVAASVSLRSNKDQARTRSSRLGPRRATERKQNSHDSEIRGKNTKSNRSDNGKQQSERHQKRNHDQFNPLNWPISLA